MGSRPWAFQRAIDGVRTFPISPKWVAQKATQTSSSKVVVSGGLWFWEFLNGAIIKINDIKYLN